MTRGGGHFGLAKIAGGRPARAADFSYLANCAAGRLFGHVCFFSKKQGKFSIKTGSASLSNNPRFRREIGSLGGFFRNKITGRKQGQNNEACLL
jgi:hypothetical protein